MLDAMQYIRKHERAYAVNLSVPKMSSTNGIHVEWYYDISRDVFPFNGKVLTSIVKIEIYQIRLFG